MDDACSAARPGRGESVGKSSRPALALTELFSQHKFVQSHCSSDTPVSHRDVKLCRKERRFCGLLSVIFDIVKPLNEVMFGRKNRSVANQN